MGFVLFFSFWLKVVHGFENLSTISLKIKYIKKNKKKFHPFSEPGLLMVWLSSFSKFDDQIIFVSFSECYQDTQSIIGSPSTHVTPHIIGAEDDDFGTEHEQVMVFFSKKPNH